MKLFARTLKTTNLQLFSDFFAQKHQNQRLCARIRACWPLYRMTTFFDPPTLGTLNTKQSWLNRSGKVDRSACFELKASSLWPHAEFKLFSRGKREAASDITINARFLTQLMDKHHPHQLQGDKRTTKTNAMKERGQESGCSESAVAGVRFQGLIPPPFKGGGKGVGSFFSSNPNKGATRTKMLGLWESWQQTIRIERQRLHKNLAQHFLICPNSPSLIPPPFKGGGKGVGSSSCQGRSLKLFITLCTKAEALDADLAEAWLNQLDTHQQLNHTPLPPSLMAHRASLINRYGLLFRAERKLVCRKCLKLRYGQVRKTSPES
ncbi:MAG: hypothetical protein IH984_10210 [Planctomycetes bacterium]|nr:hypothetical protein [Planctomycetota bacterium]